MKGVKLELDGLGTRILKPSGSTTPVFDAASSYGAQTQTSPYTIGTHTAVSSSPSGAAVAVLIRRDAVRAITGVTMGGQAMTLGTSIADGLGTDDQLSLWTLANPPSTAAIVISFSGGGSADTITAETTTVTGGDTSTVADNFVTATGTTNTISGNVTSTVGKLTCDAAGYNEHNGANITCDASQTLNSQVLVSHQATGSSRKAGDGTSMLMQWAIGFGTGTWLWIGWQFR